jgi:hypothetical protein
MEMPFDAERPAADDVVVVPFHRDELAVANRSDHSAAARAEVAGGRELVYVRQLELLRGGPDLRRVEQPVERETRDAASQGELEEVPAIDGRTRSRTRVRRSTLRSSRLSGVSDMDASPFDGGPREISRRAEAGGSRTGGGPTGHPTNRRSRATRRMRRPLSSMTRYRFVPRKSITAALPNLPGRRLPLGPIAGATRLTEDAGGSGVRT